MKKGVLILISILDWLYCKLDYCSERYDIDWLYWKAASPVQRFILYLEDKYIYEEGEARG